MAVLTVRDLDERVKHRLKRRAAANNRSMEAEVREILGAAVTDGDLVSTWLQATANLRGDPLPLAPRSLPRDVGIP
ncbi:hypothetical protein BH24ACT15_BH24ACT15_12720 [soil metagenome]